MTSSTMPQTQSAFKLGWWVLFALSVLSLLNHLSLMFFIPGEEVLFLGWAAFNLFSTLVLYIPYRRLEPWAWWATWVLVAPYAMIFLFDSEVGLYYVTAGVLMAASQFLTRKSFTS